MKKTPSRFLPLLPAILFLCHATAHANREEVVSALGGGQPYKIVLKDTSKDTKKAPGFYSRDGANWSPLFLGEVLLDPKRGPVFQLLEIGKVDDRAPIATVIDGRVHLFNILSDAKTAESFFVLGNDPVAEIGTGAKQTIPLIKTSDDFAILQGEGYILKNGSQLILLSVRQGEKGLTVALRVKRGEGAKLELEGAPLIMDHAFHKSDDLQKMIIRSSSGQIGVYSELLQNSFIGRLNLGDYGDYQSLVDALVSEQEKCQAANVNFCNAGRLARWNAETGKSINNGLISLQDYIGHLSFKVNWPLLSSTPALSIDVVDSIGSGITLQGRVRLAANGKIWRGFEGGSGVVVFALENDLYAAYAHGQIIKHAKLGPLKPGRKFDKISVTQKITKLDGKTIIYLIVSDLTGEPDSFVGTTNLYSLYLQNPGEVMPVSKPLELAKHFFPQDELTARLIVDERSEGKTLFDTLTEPQGSEGAYHQAVDKTTPLVDIAGTSSNSVKYVYTHPRVQHNLAGWLDYKEFEVKSGTENPSGIYYTGVTPNLFRGHLLSRSEKPIAEIDPEDFDLLRQAAPIQSSQLGNVSAKIFAIDPAFRKGDRGFQLVLDMGVGKGSSRAYYARELPQFNVPLRDLIDLRLVAGRQESSDQFYVLAFTTTGNIKVMSFSLSEKGISPISSSELNTREKISADELMHRLVHDQQTGGIHFIMTPNISPNSRDFQVWSFATNKLTWPKREHGEGGLTFDFDNNVASQFQTISDESSLSWKVQPFHPDSEATAAETTEMSKSALFSQFRKVLEEAADPKQPAKRKVVLMPKELKNLAMDYIRSAYLVKSRSEAASGSLFHRFNRDLGLYIFDVERSQADAFFENFEIIQARDKEKGIVVADLNSLIQVSRPTSMHSSHPFVLEVPTLVHDSDEEKNDGLVHTEAITPHSLYLMAAGAPVPYEDFRKQIPAPKATTLLFGTKEEFEQIKDEADTEMAAGVDKAFEVVELPPLTLESKTALLDEITSRPDIKGLKFEFDASDIVPDATLTPAEQQKKIFEYAVTRVEAISGPRGSNPLTAFMDFSGLFLEKILTDPIVRTSRKIDKSFIERILKTQFNLALNLADLPPEDPRVVLSSEDALFKLHRAGLLGEFDLKAEIIRLTLAQLNHDPARVMPSSWIWAGEPGTGKSKAWDALAKMLNLKLFRRGKDNSHANGFYLDTVRIKKGDAAAIDSVIADLNNFVTSPSGSAGFIFIDDLSFADDALGKALVQWIRGLQQSEKGIYRWNKADGTTVTTAVQNITIGLAMNFTDNKAQLEQFKGEDISSLVGKIVATGARFGMDKSFVDRFGGVYNFDKFHESVKEPSLNQALLEAAKIKMGRTGRFVVVDPAFIREAAGAFPQLQARPFLSKTTDSIISQPDLLPMTTTKVFAIIPKSKKEVEEEESTSKPRTTTGAWGQESGEVKQWVQKHARVVELEEGLGAQLMLTRLMVPSFRSPILESLVYAMQIDQRFKIDQLAASFFLSPALFAVYDHLERAETIPLKDLGLKHDNREELQALIEDLSTEEVSPFVVPFPDSAVHRSVWGELGVVGQRTSLKESRRDVLVKYTPKIQAVIERHLHRVLNVNNLSEMDDVESWLKNMPEKVPFGGEELGRELTNLLFQFMREFQSRDLLEQHPLDPYASTRFFLMAIDNAIAKLPWTELSKKMTFALKKISQDQVLGQSVGVQNWLFNPEDRASLLKPTTTNFIREMVEFNSQVREATAEDRAKPRTTFEIGCEQYLFSGKRSP